MVDDSTRRDLQREKIAAQESLARERMRTQETLASERGNRSVALQEQRLSHQRQAKELDAAGRADVARITGQYDLDLAQLQHDLLPQRLAVEHEYAALASELVRDELLHEAGVRALFSVAEFAAKAKISGKFDREKDERQFAHAVELEKLRQDGTAAGTAEARPPSGQDLAGWYRRIAKERP